MLGPAPEADYYIENWADVIFPPCVSHVLAMRSPEKENGYHNPTSSTLSTSHVRSTIR